MQQRAELIRREPAEQHRMAKVRRRLGYVKEDVVAGTLKTAARRPLHEVQRQHGVLCWAGRKHEDVVGVRPDQVDLRRAALAIANLLPPAYASCLGFERCRVVQADKAPLKD
jgi:hypothetical protein